MKNRIFYSQMNHDQEQARKNRSDDNAQPKYRDVKGHLLAGELFPNYPDILLNTLLFICLLSCGFYWAFTALSDKARLRYSLFSIMQSYIFA